MNVKTRKQIESYLNIRLRNKFALHLYHDVALRHERQCHQERCQELAGHVTTNLDRPIQSQFRSPNAQRWEAVLCQVVDLTPELTQCVDEVADRTLMHTRNTAQFEVSAQYCQSRGQRAHGGACISHKQGSGLSLEHTAQAFNGDAGTLHDHAATQLAESVQHNARIVGIQQIMQGCSAFAQGRQQQQTVGNAFGAW